LFRRLKERIGERAFAPIMERLYNLIVIEKEAPSKILKRLSSKVGRRSKVRKYLLEAENSPQALRLLNRDLKMGKMSRRTYYRAKKLLKEREEQPQNAPI
jgi:hypothetical protein